MSLEQKDYGIKDYAIIGNCETAALVNPDGGIDWLCLPAFDSSSIFATLLDREKGGEFFIRPIVPYRVEREYLGETALLKTRFLTEKGGVELIDFFVLARVPDARFYDFTSLHYPRKLVRIFKVIEGGPVTINLSLKSRPDYGRSRSRWRQCRETNLTAYTSDSLHFYSNLPIADKDGDLEGKFSLEQGKTYFAVLDYSDKPVPPDLEMIQRWFSVTKAFWEEWNLFNYYKGEYQHIVRRSAVTLKLLTYAPTGAFVAAPTTSLPERIGGDQNWDYRYTWIRDTSLFIDAFFRLGYSGEAKAFFHYILDCCGKSAGEKIEKDISRSGSTLKVLYPIRSESPTEEKFLDHLAGFRGSRPVKIGNHAENQLQIDNYAYLLQSLDYYRHTGGKIDSQKKEVIRHLVQEILEHWKKPDNGIWEVLEKEHYTYGKVMAWVALEKVQEVLPEEFKRQRLDAVMSEIREEVYRKGAKRRNGQQYLSKSYESNDVDASNLLAYTTGFLPKDLARATREEIEKRLGKGAFIYRNPEKREMRKEGAFLLCSFWWISHLIREGEIDRAEELLKELLTSASPLGLFSEEIDPDSGEFLGNFPQAFSHLGLINTILDLELAKKKPHFQHLSDKQKFEASVGPTIGLKGIISGFIRVPKTFQLLFSNRSKWRKR